MNNKLNNSLGPIAYKPASLNKHTQLCVMGGCLEETILESINPYEVNFYRPWRWQPCCYCPYVNEDCFKLEDLFLPTQCELM